MKRIICLSVVFVCILAKCGLARPVYFADANLKTAVEAELGISNPTATDMLGLTGSFNKARESGISDLSGLEYATNLTSLSLQDNQITDLSPLATLKNLENLYLQNNQITDISPLDGLTKLKILSLKGNQIDDVSPLANMVNIEVLHLYSNQIKDISTLVNRTSSKMLLKSLYIQDNRIENIHVLSRFTNLEELSLSKNNIQDISPLAGLIKLTYLNLSTNQIDDINPLTNLVNLESLYLYSNQITDIGPLANLTKLRMNATSLSLRENRIESIEALRGFTNLEMLYLWGNNIQDISPLAGLTKLTYLSLHTNQIENISSLTNMVNLESLYLYSNQITDIGPLAGLTKLVKLGISTNEISDINPLAPLTNLIQLNIYRNQVDDVGPLANLTNLEILSCTGNSISDIDPLAQLTSLKNLQLGKNLITSINPLTGLTNLEFIVIYHNQITDLTPLSGMTNLQRLMAHDNNIVDITPLSSLDNLQEVLLGDNQIRDISSLVDFTGLTWLDLRSNPLNEEAYSIYIPQIQQNNPLDHAEGMDLFGTVIPAGLSYDDTILYEIMPKYHGNAVDITLTITGAGFDPQVAIELVDDNDESYMASSVEYISTTRVEATFSAHSIPAGMYSLNASQGLNQDFLLNAFEVLEGGSPNLVTSLELPDILGYHDLKTIYVEYKNDGEITMQAPLLHITATQNNKQAALLTLYRKLATQGLDTSTLPEGFSHSIQILAQGSSPGRLHPGESVRVPIYWAGWLQPWDYSYPPVYIGLGVLTVDEATPINYDQMEQAIRPTNMDALVWAAIWANFTDQTGTTWGDYVRMLDDNATYLARINRDITDMSELLAFEFTQANGRGILSHLAGSGDAAVAAPGLDIVLTRAFLPSMTSRYHTGPFGRGWYHNWDRSLTENQDDTVIIEGPFGSHRIFQPDGSGGYSSQAGDYGQLVEIFPGTYELVESNGVRSVFSAEGLLSYIVDTNGNRITASYTNGLLSKLTHSSGQWLQLAYNSNGRIASITGSSGLQTTYGYDTGNEHLVTVELSDGSTVGYVYNTGSGPALEHSLARIEYPGGTHRFFTYDTQGRLTATYKDGHTEPLTLTYDSAGTIAITDAYSSTAKYFLDHKGLVGKIVDPLGRSIYVGHDRDYNLTELTDTAGNSYIYGYDQQGNLTQWTDPLGNITQFEYSNIYNRMTNLIDANLNQTRYEYDAEGNLNSIIYPDETVESWAYDGLGNATAWTNRRGSQITYQYNTVGQITAKFYPTQEPASYAYDAHGNLTSYTDSIGTTELTYDVHNRLERITYPGDRYLEYSYDTAGRRATCTDQLGHVLTYAYDAVGRLESITDTDEGKIVSYQYDDAGRLAMKILGNGVHTTYAYDIAGQILSLVNVGPDDTVLSTFDYEYDSLGRRISMTTPNGTWLYEYDDLGQLTAWTDPDGRHVEYIYDALGNRTTVVDDNVSSDYTTNHMNQYTQAGDTTYTYDADGNMQSKTDSAGTTTYEYNHENRLIRVVVPAGDVWDYIYDGLGNRVAVIENGTETQFVHDPIGIVDVAGEYADNGDVAARYVHGYGLASRFSSTGDAGYYSFDALGSTSEMTDHSGQIINNYTYDPFGESLLSAETMPNAFRFVGEYGVMHEGNGLDFMRARYYDASTGRFAAMDPIGLNGGDINLLKYAMNNPLSFVDPVGEISDEGELLYAIALDFLHPFVTAMTATEWQDWVPGSYTRQVVNEQNKYRKPRYIPSQKVDRPINEPPRTDPLGHSNKIPSGSVAPPGPLSPATNPDAGGDLPIPPDIGDSGIDPIPVPSRETEPDPDPDPDPDPGTDPDPDPDPGTDPNTQQPDYIHTLTVKSSGASGVVISSSTEGAFSGRTDYVRNARHEMTVMLTAPESTSTYINESLYGIADFIGWSGDINSGNRTISVLMDRDKTVTAIYLLSDVPHF